MPICVLVDLSPGHSEIPLSYSEYIAQDPTNLIKTGVCITNLRLVGLETASTTQGPAELSGTCPSRSTAHLHPKRATLLESLNSLLVVRIWIRH